MNAAFFKQKEAALKISKTDYTGCYSRQSTAVTEASNRNALLTAKERKPHTIRETLILPCAKEIVMLLCGEAGKKLNNLSLSNNTVQRRISGMSNDIKM